MRQDLSTRPFHLGLVAGNKLDLGMRMRYSATERLLETGRYRSRLSQSAHAPSPIAAQSNFESTASTCAELAPGLRPAQTYSKPLLFVAAPRPQVHLPVGIQHHAVPVHLPVEPLSEVHAAPLASVPVHPRALPLPAEVAALVPSARRRGFNLSRH